MTCFHRWISVLVAVAVTVGAASARADSPAALVLAVTGDSTPPIEEFSELAPENPIELAADTEIEFMHYASCETVTVRGGRLNFTRERFLSSGGKILDRKRSKCPKTIAVSGASQIGGVVLRSGKSRNSVPTRPTFVLVGARADDFGSIAVSQGDKTLLRAEIESRVFPWPEATPDPAKGEPYVVTLRTSDGKQEKRLTVRTSRRSGKGTLTLLRVD